MVGGLRWNPLVGNSGSQVKGTTILVSGLAASVRKTDLQGAFGEFGRIVRLDLDGNKAYLEFDDPRDAQDAVESMNGKTVRDCRMKVEMKHRQETPIDRQRREGLEALQESRRGARSRSRSGGAHRRSAK
eukprot:gnl/TRDRNA2_/TRDRNA2_190044_c0_seq1.p1 gnl/TRDRNA2_/TRDRNA2_190044_c0~~gnl/TRDRNA2_/TRDRNA2_190044_c0_seq1.p1  ORF type:complete len:130 (-),score=22.28 gnl/TRDRNA2_/TRDRNA2_190044_c0_seq1:286-675(-)